MTYKYYSRILFIPIKHIKEGKYKEVFNNLPHFIKNILHVNCLHNILLVYNDNVLIRKLQAIPPIPYFIIPVDYCQNIQYIINFTSDDMISKVEVFKNHKLDTFYITEIMRTEWILMIDEYWVK